jgi:capsular exopolysaccharide synthesis family protein
MATGTQEEAYRILRSNLEVALLDLERAAVAVTSAHAGEGKTSTTVNLARSLAVAGNRVVLLDFDLRHPDSHRWLGTHNDFGVSDVLLRQRSLPESLQFVVLGEGVGGAREGLYFLPAGTPVRNPAELLGGPRTPALLDALAAQADVVLIDTPPVLPVADTLVIGRMVAGAVLVVETRRAPAAAVRKAKDALIRNQTRLLGVVVNKLQQRDARTDEGYGYAYDYPYVHPDGRSSGRSHRRRSKAETSPTWPTVDGQLAPASTDQRNVVELYRPPITLPAWHPISEVSVAGDNPASSSTAPTIEGRTARAGHPFAPFEVGPSTNGGELVEGGPGRGSEHPAS